ncbi:pentapeptide repeat-containing protein [Modestobacter caceresii]|uniref:pentapeptide repeat-containing protein n=1 Tax=Modestobacter caceresii TaxID=1522368 RepID=UPI0012E046BB|nr:pentapeptide repeat-containing protein [Modestobacter caceresii]
MLLTVGVAWLFWSVLGRPELTGGPLDTGGLIDALKLVLAVVGGTGAVFALTIAYRKQRHGEAAEYREDNKLFNERYAKGAELLGHERAPTRMAGLYALARLADDVEDYERRQQCIDALCAYLRLPYAPGPNETGETKAERTVRRTTLRVIRDHLREDMAATSWDGHKFNLASAVFDGGDLARIRLSSGHMTFHDAIFVQGVFTFDKAEIQEDARIWFSDVRFAGGDVRFHGALLGGKRVSFDGARFDSGVVSFREVRDPDGIVTFDNAIWGAATVEWGPFTPPNAAIGSGP